MGFGGVWRAWIRNCLTFTKSFVLVNGSSYSYFGSEKGLRQGDPLSPFLFTIIGEVLSCMLSKAQEFDQISGFSVKEGRTNIYHLQFADDNIILLDAKREQVDALCYPLLFFDRTSGLKKNFSTSSLFWVGVEEGIEYYVNMLGCKNVGKRCLKFVRKELLLGMGKH
ncbi:uncharacterized protein LOC113291629 [Papaver somniferum]|uniref:uncharacterized protein LOC113291629 n=1 Tax=Papaver somniferum TaxID=3469 RepID=UPI000E703FC2|nr:uncharacterized protein LOC113291629 [Papaver somniferum]